MLNVKKMLIDLANQFIPQTFSLTYSSNVTYVGYTTNIKVGRFAFIGLDFTVNANASGSDLLIATLPSGMSNKAWRTVFPLVGAWAKNDTAIAFSRLNEIRFGGTAYTANKRYMGNVVIVLD